MTSVVWAGTVFGPRLWSLSAHRHSLAASTYYQNQILHTTLGATNKMLLLIPMHANFGHFSRLYSKSTVSYKNESEKIGEISYGLYCRVVCITRNFFEFQNPRFIIESGFKSRADYNGARTVSSYRDILCLKWTPALFCHDQKNSLFFAHLYCQ